jgi:hypothetical protein
MPLADPAAGQGTIVHPAGVGRSRGLEPGGRHLGKAGAVTASIGRQIAEIRDDPALRVYGVGLALVNLLSVLFWYTSGELRYFDLGTEPICWPLVPGCAAWRVLTAAQASVLLAGFASAACLVAAAFAVRRLVGAAWAGLLLLNLVKLALLAFDYRLRHNQHYMALFAAAAFLLVPGKRDALRALIVLFYFWAGTLKLNWEWISGAALYRPLWFLTGVGVIAACAYVVVLELVISWGLLAERAWVFWTTFAQIVLFHVMSWAIVDFFYPLLMFALIAIYPLARLVPRPGARVGLLGPLMRGTVGRGSYAMVATFSILQLVPHAYPGDQAVTGEGRLYALHMFDAKVECEAYADVRAANGTVRRLNLRRGLLVRIDCDPIVLYGRARNLCEHRSQLADDVAELDLRLRARRTTDPILHEVIDVPRFCARRLRYDPIRHNPWIGTA